MIYINIYKDQLNPCTETMNSFLSLMVPERTHLQTFPDDKQLKELDHQAGSLTRNFNSGDMLERLKGAVEAHLRGYGVAFLVNYIPDDMPRNSENIKQIRALFVDIDTPNARRPDFPLAPHIEVESSPGRYHLYWLVEDVPVEAFARLQKALIALFGADPSRAAASAVMRLPGTFNLKNPAAPHLVRIVQLDRERPRYSVDRFTAALATDLPDEDLMAQEPTSAVSTSVEADLEAIEAALQAIPIADYERHGGRAGWLRIGMALHSTGHEEAALALWDRWSSGALQGVTTPSNYRGLDDLRKAWSSFRLHKKKGVNIGTLFYLAQQHGWVPATHGLQNRDRWQARLHRNRDSKGKPTTCKGNLHNYQLILRFHPGWAGVIAHNDLSASVVKLDTPPFEGGEAGEWSDVDITCTSIWLSDQYSDFSNPAINTVLQAVNSLARYNRFDPLADYLNSLQWDGKPRLATWMIDYLGTADTEYVRKVSRKWPISAVARALQPGCKVDTVLVLTGARGERKSTLLKLLASEPWFVDTDIALDNKDFYEIMLGHWIIELGEMVSTSRASNERAKQFFSRTHDSWVRKYDKLQTTLPRRCVFVCTGNHAQFLKDETGNRRYWPIEVENIDIEGIQRIREQLWAEAVQCYRAGESWWVMEEEKELFEEAQEARRVPDPWEDLLQAELARWPEEFISTAEIEALLGIDPQALDRGVQYRIASVMETLKCGHHRAKINGKRVRGYRINRKVIGRSPVECSPTGLRVIFPR